jgi:hypothetical protein
MLGQQAVGIAQIAKETGLTRQTVYRIKGDPAGADGALGVGDYKLKPLALCDALYVRARSPAHADRVDDTCIGTIALYLVNCLD